jgi:hypothetical protein
VRVKLRLELLTAVPLVVPVPDRPVLVVNEPLLEPPLLRWTEVLTPTVGKS